MSDASFSAVVAERANSATAPLNDVGHGVLRHTRVVQDLDEFDGHSRGFLCVGNWCEL